MKQLAFPTPTTLLQTINDAPGHRPLGKSGMTVKSDQPEAQTPLSKPNRKTKNGGYFNLGVRSDDIPKKFDQRKGTPLSKPDANGNQADTALILKPTFAEPKNEMMKDILNILNAKVIPAERMGNLTAGQVRELDRRRKAKGKQTGLIAESPLQDFAETQMQMTKEKLIRNAMAEGFSRAEAIKGYEKLREGEVVAALKKERQPSEQLREILDSKFGTGEEGTAAVGNPLIREVSITRGTQTDLTVGSDITLVARPRRYRTAEEAILDRMRR